MADELFVLRHEAAEAVFRDGLCLPSGTALSEGDLARVVGVARR